MFEGMHRIKKSSSDFRIVQSSALFFRMFCDVLCARCSISLVYENLNLEKHTRHKKQKMKNTKVVVEKLFSDSGH